MDIDNSMDDIEITSDMYLSQELWGNVDTLLQMVMNIYPNQDYSNFESSMRSLNIVDDNTIPSYSMYDNEKTTLKLNIKKILDDRIDTQHLMLNEMLMIGSKAYDSNESLLNLNRGVAEVIALTMNSDESMKKLYPIEYQEAALFTKIVDPDTLVNSFMKQDYAALAVELDKHGINNDEFLSLINSMNTGANGFAKTEEIMTNMFAKKISTSTDLSNDDIVDKFSNFKDSLVFNKVELMSIFPYYDFFSIGGFDILKQTVNGLEESIKKQMPSDYKARL